MKNSRILSLFSLTLLMSIPGAYAMEAKKETSPQQKLTLLNRRIKRTRKIARNYKKEMEQGDKSPQEIEKLQGNKKALEERIKAFLEQKAALTKLLASDSGPQEKAPELSAEETTEAAAVIAPAPVIKKEESKVVINNGWNTTTLPARLFTAKILKDQREQLKKTKNKDYREAPQTTSLASDYGIVEFNRLNHPSVVQCKTSKAQKQMYKATNPLTEYSRSAGFWGTYSESSLIEDFQKALETHSTDNLNLSRIKEDTDRSLKQIGAVLPSQLKELESNVVEPTTQDTHRIVAHYTQIIDNTFARLTNAATILGLYQQLKDQGLIKFEICSETLQNVENSNKALRQLIKERNRLQNNMNVRLKAESNALENLIARAK